MQANDITRDRLRGLAEARVGDVKVLSLFVNLDPREFATPAARSTEVRSILDRAGRLVREESERLTHEQKESLRSDLERVASELGNGAGTKGAHGLAIFSASAAGLFEVLRLAEPIDHDPVISDTPYVAPLSLIGPPGYWCVVLVNRRTARLFCGSSDALDEIALIDDGVRNRHDQGGWSQANYQRSVDKDVQDHLKHTAEVVFDRMKRKLPEGLLVGGPAETLADFEGVLHPYLRERLAGRHRHRRGEQLRRGRAPLRRGAHRGRPRRARRPGPRPPRRGLRHERPRRHRAVRRPHRHRTSSGSRRCSSTRATAPPGVVCPQCGWLGGKGFSECQADGTPVERRDDIVEVVIERVITQSADVHVLRDRPELASHGHIAAILRF